MSGEIAQKLIDDKSNVLIELAAKIWENPEIAFQEVKACQWTADVLKKEGFEVEKGYAGVPTALRGVWGSGKPVIGFLGEYDALADLSQQIKTVKEPAEEGAPGHGCGHNLMTPACIGAAMGLKKEMEEKKLKGTIVVYGCPAEEVLTGKAFMARGGAFRELDIAFSWHPGTNNMLNLGIMAALNSAVFHFKGITAHAGAYPFNGRSALDAAELMNVGANFLREHVPDITRIHYAFTEVHGAPNVVPDRASVWYYVRALSRDTVIEVYERLIKVARGAAMMTETEVEVEFMGGCYNTMQNETLVNVIKETMDELPQIDWSREDIKFAEELNNCSPNYDKMVAAGYIEKGIHLDNAAPSIIRVDAYGSNDVSEVQYICPTACLGTPCTNNGAVIHQWQTTACAGHSIGMKGMLQGAKIMAVTALKALENPEIITKAKTEFDKAMKGRSYVCPIPDEIPVP